MTKRKRKGDSNADKQHVREENWAHPNSQAAQGIIVIPQKKLYRQRAHVNVFSDHNLVYPTCPSQMDWHFHFPDRIAADQQQHDFHIRAKQPKVEFADIGCGFGGLLFYLAPLFPDKLIVGMEIRSSVTQYVHDKIQALRAASKSNRSRTSATDADADAEAGADDGAGNQKHNGALHELDDANILTQQSTQPEEETEANINTSMIQEASQINGGYQNISALRVNAMKFLPNFFEKAQLTKMFFLHPDPHFKVRKSKNRIISATLLAEYAYVLRPDGILYTITDVHDLHLWMVKYLDAFPLFARIPDEELVDDVCVEAVWSATEEGKKVVRNRGQKWFAAYRRVQDDQGGDAIE